ncbi:MAG: hypothetical protein IJV01_02975 [Bacteroidales bacterium]|nr:hypothetical protein [Bacteroidales bacterium]
MAAQYKSKHGIVSRPQSALYMAFTDLRRFVDLLPEDKRASVTADSDHISATVQGFSIGVRVSRREPWSYMELQDDGAPFHFTVGLHFDPSPEEGKTDFSITLDADLNLMMKMMLGSKLQEGLDKIVDGLVAVSEGRVPEGMPQDFQGFGL